jgi:DinB family protein
MNKTTAELLSHLDTTRQALIETVSPINPAFAGMKPRDKSWSVEQNMSHLAIVEDGVARLLAKSVAWAKANGIGRDASDDSMLASLDQFGIADAKFKRESPSGVVPDERPIADSLSSLASSRVRLKDVLLDGDGLDLTKVTRPHPAMGDIDLYQWVLFVGQHEERHRRQIERTLTELTEMVAESAPIV